MEKLVQAALDFISAHPYTTGGILAVVGVLAWFKLKLVLKAVTACLILGAFAYVIMFIVNLTSTGIDNTEKLLDAPNEAIDKLQ